MEKVSLKNVFFSIPFIFTTYFSIILSTCYTGNPVIGNILEILSVLFSILIIGGYILERKYSKFSLLLFIFMIVGLITSQLGTYSNPIFFLKAYYKIVTISLLTELGIRNEAKKTLSVLNIVFFILVFINFYTIIRYPVGMLVNGYKTNFWFFKYDNVHILLFFPAILVSMICSKFNKRNKKISFLMLLMITYQVYYCFSATTVVAYTLFLIYILFSGKIDKIKIFSPKNYFVLYFLMFIFIVILSAQDVLSWLIVDVLGKDLTFTGRTIIWEKIIEYIKLKPIIGYGFEPTDIITWKLGNPSYTHAHNTLLDLMYKGGVLSLVAFVSLLNSVIKRLEEYKNNKIAKLVSFVMLCLFVMFNFESREDRIGLYIILSIGYNIKFIIDNIKEEKKEYEDDKENN